MASFFVSLMTQSQKNGINIIRAMKYRIVHHRLHLYSKRTFG